MDEELAQLGAALRFEFQQLTVETLQPFHRPPLRRISLVSAGSQGGHKAIAYAELRDFQNSMSGHCVKREM